jgi:signal transduction histidine kinase
VLLIEFLLLVICGLVVAIALLRVGAAELSAAAQPPAPVAAQPDDETLAAVGLMMTFDLCEEVITPVTVILAECDLGRGTAEADSSRLARIEEHARRIAAAVEQHRGFAPSGRQIQSSVDLRQAAGEALASVLPLALELDVALHPHIDNTPPVIANPVLLRAVMRHMIRAGIRSVAPGRGDVTVAVGELEGCIAFCVADDGPGMDEGRVRQVLDDEQGDASPPHRTGASYALVQAIAGASGATLVIDSDPGHGTRATLKLPVRTQKTPRRGAMPARHAVHADG